MPNSTFISVPTGYNVYKVKNEVLQTANGMMAVMPAAVVMETLVMQGDAKIVARIKPYDIDTMEDPEEFIEQEYNPTEGRVTDSDENIPLPGPWFEEDNDA